MPHKMSVKNVVILGSTGSIGINALKVIKRFKGRFKVVGLSAYRNIGLLEKQIKQFNPKCVALDDKNVALLKRRIHPRKVRILNASDGLEKIVARRDVDIVILGIQGSAALKPFLAAVRHGKIVAPANKEALVMAGPIIMREAKKHKATIVPVDSEQSAIFQCLQGQAREQVKKVYLTGSGGPLKDVDQKCFDAIPVKKILKHPRWRMGKKITVDSATLMNKGLEIIEAMWLFGLKAHEVDVVIHPQSIVHSMVEFDDGAVIAQLGVTDMCIPIQYALTYPQRMKTGLGAIDFVKQGQLTFEKPNFKKFPSLCLCYEVARKGKTFGSVLNAANEEAVEAFLKGRIKFSKIYKVVSSVVKKHQTAKKFGIKEILKADQWARQQAQKMMG
ncbi:MAG: 1-deoxy-D-xylulose-5-phosphate reductoisomerase [Candidatus Aceula meridiana]|nr:1-deoxy-D-xylulose-5-phosphate reductoisomerase [Candidatus Aceula meridiana]